MNELARTLVIFGLVLIAAGGALMLFGKVPGLGKLPGDIAIRRDGFSFYFPLTTCLVLSAVLTLLFNLFGKK
jgi:formate hydrogenlyase subunit 3/multisubunit Na+/H+ antiporter MnhD subunit